MAPAGDKEPLPLYPSLQEFLDGEVPVEFSRMLIAFHSFLPRDCLRGIEYYLDVQTLTAYEELQQEPEPE